MDVSRSSEQIFDGLVTIHADMRRTLTRETQNGARELQNIATNVVYLSSWFSDMFKVIYFTIQ